jgi:hypothetical protein
VHPGNWKKHTVGHVGPAVRPNGNFVSGDIHVEDGDTMERAQSGELKEVSCGYTCDIDPIPGEYQGQRYDVAQRNIRMNHVAIGPVGWGRMGRETAMRLDAGEAVSGESDDELRADAEWTAAFVNNLPDSAFLYIAPGGDKDGEGKTMPRSLRHLPYRGADGKVDLPHLRDALSRIPQTDIPAAKKTELTSHAQKMLENQKGDGGDYLRAEHAQESTMTPEEKAAFDKAIADAEKARQDAADAKAAADKLEAKLREDKATIGTLTTERDQLKTRADQVKRESESADALMKQDAAAEARVTELFEVRADARVVFASTDDPKGEKWKHLREDGKPKTVDQIRREVIAELNPKLRLDGIDSITQDVAAEHMDAAKVAQSKALRSVFDAEMSRKRDLDKARQDAIDTATKPRLDGTEGGEGDDDEDDDGEPPMTAAAARKQMIKKKKTDWKRKKADRGASASAK